MVERVFHLFPFQVTCLRHYAIALSSAHYHASALACIRQALELTATFHTNNINLTRLCRMAEATILHAKGDKVSHSASLVIAIKEIVFW